MSTATPPVGARFGNPSEMLSVNPLTISNMPKRDDERGDPEADRDRAVDDADDAGAEQCQHDAERKGEPGVDARRTARNGAMKYTEPIERSISPHTSNIV